MADVFIGNVVSPQNIGVGAGLAPALLGDRKGSPLHFFHKPDQQRIKSEMQYRSSFAK